MVRVMLDTRYWIDFEHDPSKFERFRELTVGDKIEVLFSFGNLLDLTQRDEQDTLSGIIATVVDKYIPAMDYEGDEYIFSTDPLMMIPDDADRRVAELNTVDFGEEKTLRFMFRSHNWEVPEMYAETTKNTKELIDEFGFKNTTAATFHDYVREEDGRPILWEHEIDVSEYVRKMVEQYRVFKMADEEKVDLNDLADMEIISQAILTDCDILLTERKWKNIGLIDFILSKLEGHQGLEVYDDFDEFMRVLEQH